MPLPTRGGSVCDVPRTADEDDGKRERWEEEALLGSSPKALQSLAFHDWRVGH